MEKPLLTAINLQDALVQELQRLLDGLRLPAPSGFHEPVHYFADDLPIPQTDDAPDPFPYIIVRLANGVCEPAQSDETATVNLVFGCYDRDLNHQGHRDVLGLIERVKQRFCKNPVLGPYEQTGRIEWVREEEDPYPYYFGGLQLIFRLPAMQRESEFS